MYFTKVTDTVMSFLNITIIFFMTKSSIDMNDDSEKRPFPNVGSYD